MGDHATLNNIERAGRLGLGNLQVARKGSSSVEESDRPARRQAFARYLAIASGDGDLAELDELVTADFLGHVGERTRDLGQLKRDIAAYRAAADNIRFQVEHRFVSGAFVAARVSATAVRRSDGQKLVASGINISRWDDDLLAEEWAVWEPLHPSAVASAEPSQTM